LPRLHHWCSCTPKQIRDGWLAWETGIGEQVVVAMGSRTIRGTAAGIDENGALLVQEGSTLVTCLAGDVHLQ